MSETLNAQQLIRLAQSLTRMQSAITDYEIRQYDALSASQKGKIELALTELARAAGILYAYSVQLAFEDAEGQLKKLKSAAYDMSRFLKTTKKIQRVLDLVSSVAGIAAAVISYDLNGVVSGIDEVVQILANP